MVHFFSVYSFVVVTYLAVFVLLGMFSQHQGKQGWVWADGVNACMTVALTIMGWYYTSTSPVDLDRIMQQVQQARTYGLSFLFEQYLTTPLSAVILLIGYVTNDPRYLQVFGVFVTYGLFFVLTGILRRNMNVDPVLEAVGASILLFGFNFVTAATNIRFWIALNCIVIGIAIHECYGKKIPLVLLSIVGLLIHTGAAIIVVIYIAAVLLGKKLFTIFCVILLVYPSSMTFISPLLSNSSIPFVSQIGEKISIYYGLTDWYDNTYDAQMIEAGGRNSPLIMLILSSLIFLVYYQARKLSPQHLPTTIEKLIAATLCFDFGSYNSYTVFVRFALFVTFISILVLYSGLHHYFIADPGEMIISDTKSSHVISRHIMLLIGLFLLFVLLRRDISYVYWSSYLSFI